jgi:hypothetical protein
MQIECGIEEQKIDKRLNRIIFAHQGKGAPGARSHAVITAVASMPDNPGRQLQIDRFPFANSGAFLALQAFRSSKDNFSARILGLNLRAGKTPERTPLKVHHAPNPRTVVKAESLNIDYQRMLHVLHYPVPFCSSAAGIRKSGFRIT